MLTLFHNYKTHLFSGKRTSLLVMYPQKNAQICRPARYDSSLTTLNCVIEWCINDRALLNSMYRTIRLDMLREENHNRDVGAGPWQK